MQIILYPALVQGEGASESIVKGIHALEAEKVDVMIVQSWRRKHGRSLGI